MIALRRSFLNLIQLLDQIREEELNNLFKMLKIIMQDLKLLEMKRLFYKNLNKN